MKNEKFNIGDKVQIKEGASEWMKSNRYWCKDWTKSIDGVTGTITHDCTVYSGNDCHYGIKIDNRSDIDGCGVHPKWLTLYGTKQENEITDLIGYKTPTLKRMPAGRYYIGDPCYVIKSDESWKLFCEACRDFDFVQWRYKGMLVAYGHTSYGDGTYKLKYKKLNMKDLGVDAGLIGIIPMEIVEAEVNGTNYADNKKLGYNVIFPDTFEISYTDGNFRFGQYTIKT